MYELLVVHAPGVRRATSLAAEPELFGARGEYYHEACGPVADPNASPPALKIRRDDDRTEPTDVEHRRPGDPPRIDASGQARRHRI